ncbi:hypothetical protein [Actinokineospora sp. HUAS TT18]|uniref:hypothetical protein n=1 Tax=Actinokineospora sp. HUAS TT18 TaxID=3447451 RepID=UPI003F51AEB9
MATTEEIEHRVRHADTARSAKRAAAARQVGDLAQRRAALADQVDDVERELGEVLAAVQDVMTIDELAVFTDVPAADLTRWLTARTTRKSSRPKRRQPTDTDSQRSAKTPTARAAAEPPGTAEPPAGAPDLRGAVPAEVT